MRVTEVLGIDPFVATEVNKYHLLDQFEIFASNEEVKLLEKLKEPRKLSSLSETDQFRIHAMIRKSLVTKIGMTDPMVVANEKAK